MHQVALTIGEAAAILHPPVGERQLRDIIRALGWQPSGWKRSGKPGHPHPVYDWHDLCELHAALVPLLHRELVRNRL